MTVSSRSVFAHHEVCKDPRHIARRYDGAACRCFEQEGASPARRERSEIRHQQGGQRDRRVDVKPAPSSICA